MTLTSSSSRHPPNSCATLLTHSNLRSVWFQFCLVSTRRITWLDYRIQFYRSINITKANSESCELRSGNKTLILNESFKMSHSKWVIWNDPCGSYSGVHVPPWKRFLIRGQTGVFSSPVAIMFLLDAVVSFVHIPPETSSILLIIWRVLLTNEDVFSSKWNNTYRTH